jgi:hypothetical protein
METMTRTRCAVLAALLVALTALPAAADSAGRPTLLAPGAGQTLGAGSEVTIQWNGRLTACTRQFFGEQEIHLSLDGGRTFPYRITPRLSYTDRSFTWRVPNLPSEDAVLDLRYGCENEPGECEPFNTVVDAFNPQFQSRFRIVDTGVDYVGHPLLFAPAQAYPGDTVKLSGDARVKSLDHYEVMASVDRGGQFTTIGTTEEPAFAWTLPADGLRCSYLFKVAAVLGDGSRIESIVDTTQMVYVNQVPHAATTASRAPKQ